MFPWDVQELNLRNYVIERRTTTAVGHLIDRLR